MEWSKEWDENREDDKLETEKSGIKLWGKLKLLEEELFRCSRRRTIKMFWTSEEDED